MKKLLLIIACLVLSCSLSAPKSYVQHVTHSTVALVIQDDEGTFRPFCSGVFIGDNKILTAAHCVNALADKLETTTDHLKVHYLTDAEVSNINEEPFAVHLAEAAIVDDTRDIAELKMLGPAVPHDTAKLASEPPRVGQHVAIVGMPRGLYFTYEEGTISGVRDASFAHSSGLVLQVDSSAWFGNSGGGVFDESGHLLGICSRLTPVPHMSLFMQVDKKVIEKLEE